jgi:hypothetical protein
MNAPLPPNWIVPDWAAPRRVRAVITTRAGGDSRGAYAGFNLGERVGDVARAVARNRQVLRSHLPSDPLWMRQVHGTNVIDADATGPAADIEGDAAVTRSSHRVLAVLTADCMPVLMCDDSGSVIGVAHAGWRGLAAGVIEAAVHAMKVDPERLLAYIGPAIGASAYEVGAEVREAFVAGRPSAAHAFTTRADAMPGKYLADLALLARQRLGRCGVMRISGGTHCTLADRERFYSFRRDGATGRFASLIWISDS